MLLNYEYILLFKGYFFSKYNSMNLIIPWKITSLMCTIFRFTELTIYTKFCPHYLVLKKYIRRTLAQVCCILLYECAPKPHNKIPLGEHMNVACLTTLLNGFLPCRIPSVLWFPRSIQRTRGFIGCIVLPIYLFHE